MHDTCSVNGVNELDFVRLCQCVNFSEAFKLFGEGKKITGA